ncbi:MAG: hypothetical protein JW795_15625 [Chitinivibrionales bacterium]|nr:hypothetical protein [Chitinivibrionales bacterium]
MIQIKILNLSLFPLLLLAGFCVGQDHTPLIQEYAAQSAEVLVPMLYKDLASNAPLSRDKALQHLGFLLNTGKNPRKGDEAIARLAENKEFLSIASDIVTQRLAGWYEERDAQEKMMPFYYPLIKLLSISKSKIAGMTLLMALPIVGFDGFFRESACSHELVLKNMHSKLATIENKLCCFYPGKDLICDMQSIDLRCAILGMYLSALEKGNTDSFRNRTEMIQFVSDCLGFGDETKGRFVRTMAVELACVLIKAGQGGLLPAVKKIAASDPYYIYRINQTDSTVVPQFDIARKHFPVREKASTELAMLR